MTAEIILNSKKINLTTIFDDFLKKFLLSNKFILLQNKTMQA